MFAGEEHPAKANRHFFNYGKINEIAETEHCHFQQAVVFCKGNVGDIDFSVFKTDNISVGSAL